MTTIQDGRWIFRFQDFELDLLRGCLIGERGEVELRPKSFEVLCYLVTNAGRLARKDEIVKAVWPNVVVTDASLAQCVSEIRLALGDQDQLIIKTVARRGYLFAAPLSRMAAPDAEDTAIGASATPTDPPPAPELPAGQAIHARRPAERRQLTVMACEWMDLAGLATRLDPEDLCTAVTAWQQRCKDIAARYQGYVALTPDDGALVYFGYPAASEHDAEHAVRAGLDLLGSRSSSGVDASPLSLRIAVASGTVVITEESTERQAVAVGACPHIARRLLAQAPAGTLTIDHDTRQLIGRWFDYRDADPVARNDNGEPLPAWNVIGLSRIESRFDALRTGTPAVMVGREEELEFVLRRWQRARSGQGQVVLIAGEAGIGKSRLAAAVLEHIRTETHAALRYFGSPHHTGSAFYPIIRELEGEAGIMPGDVGPLRFEKLEALLARTSAPAAEVAALAELLSVRDDGHGLPVAPTPQQRRKRTIDAIMHRFAAEARRRPVIVVVEDAHWIDPSTLDVLSRLIDGIARMRVLLIVTYRPEFTPPWVGAPEVGLLTLSRLAKADCIDVIGQIAGPRHLADDAVDAIVAHSDGTPLFLEELTRTFLDVGTMAAELAAPVDNIAVPSVLNASLMARLDRLGTAREVAQVGAAIGREFSYELLAAVTADGDRELADKLDRLVDGGLLLREGRAPDASFRFKHALVQHTAYSTLLRDARRGLHARIVDALERTSPDLRGSEPETLARHYFEAGQLQRAVACWSEAGELALRRSAVKEAVVHLGTALEVANRAADAGEVVVVNGARVRLETAYGQALLWAKDMQETVAVFAHARELAASAPDAPERFAAFYGLWVGTLMRGTLEPAQELADTFLRDTEGRQGTSEFAVAQRVVGATFWHRGEFARARAHLELALAAYDAARDGDLAIRFGLDLDAASAVLLAATLWPMGELDRARRLLEQANVRAAESGHARTQVYVRTYAFIVEMMRGDAANAMFHAQAMLDLSREHALAHLDYAAICHAWARCRLGEGDDALAEMRTALVRLRQRGGALGTPWCLSMLADAEQAAGDSDASLATLDASLAEARRTGDHWYSAESERLRGDALLACDPPDAGAAEEAYRAALAIAEQQKAKSLALRASLSLARLQAATERNSDATSVLALALTGLAPSAELPEIDQARALLAQLRANRSKPG